MPTASEALVQVAQANERLAAAVTGMQGVLTAMQAEQARCREAMDAARVALEAVRERDAQEQTAIVQARGARWEGVKRVINHPAVYVALLALAWWLVDALGVQDHVRAAVAPATTEQP